ncbi:MAG: aldose 1-epimerase family protein [Clostridia bacterium]|nr:aldose 1-epimerase family protein [Clostridia bacterium]
MNPKVSNLKQIMTLRRYTVTDGAEKGLDVIDCDNGKLRFLINVTKALDIMQLYHEGQNMSFVSKNGFSPLEHDFGNRFEGGMLYTCGFDAVGGREGYTTHGRHHNNTAEIVVAKCDEEEIAVEGIVRDTAIFGENLVLRRRISTKLGSDTLTIEDTLTNEGFTPADYAVLYHVNVGYPMLDEGGEIKGNVKNVIPRTPYAKECLDEALKITAPEAGREEMCYYLDVDGEIALENKRINKTFKLSFTKDTLPEFLEWKAEASGDFALGLEPSTTRLDENLSFKTLQAGEKKIFKIEISVK